ncbi:MAG: hypothetical protein IJI37_00075, partial [Opitutales bacterium]|nr:hypothetical protein [Opitutales bacterium]
MSREAMGVFKREAYDSYYKRYAKYFGNLIVAEFTDEPALTSTHYELGGSGAPYSLDFIGEFKKVYGFDPVPHFHKLFLDVEGARKYRLQHYRIAVRLFENNFMGQLGDACASRGIALTGHCMSEDSLYGQLQWSGRIMPYYRKMGIPGIDHLGRHTSGNVFTAKQCQSVCNQYGKKRMLSEMYGCSGGSLSFEDRQWIAYQQLIGGVNMIVPHLSLFSQTGCRKRDYPQNINYQQSWYGLNAAVDVPLARACYAISQGKYAADILLISPQDGVPAVWRINPDGKKPRANTAKETYDAVIKLHKNFADSVKALFGSQFTFDLGDEQLLEEDGFVRGREIGIKNMSYKVVVLPAMANMRPSTLKMLKEFSANGGLVLRTGDAAEFLDGEKSAELDEFLKGVKLVSLENLKAEIDKFTKPLVDVERKSGDASNLWTHVRDYNDGSRFIMLANLSRFENFDGVLKISGGYTRAQILDTDTGEISDVYAKSAGDTLEMKLDLLRARALFLRVSKEKPVALAPKKTETLAEAAIDGWKAERLDDNSLLLDYASFSFDGGKRGIDGEVPAIEISHYLNAIKYDGDVVVRYKFKASNFDPSRKLKLVVEYPEKASIKVNGKEVKYAGLPFWRDFRWLPIDITGLAKEGENLIEVSYPNFKYGDPTVYKPQWRRYGTEIEAAYLVGDFSVIAKDTGAKALNSHFKVYQSKPTKTVMIGKDGLAITNPKPISAGNQTLGGLPFYTGRVCYSKKIDAPKLGAGERLFIKLGNLDCPVAEVLVDGKRAGLIKNEPFELDITGAVKTPNPEIKIVLYATLRNAMDAPHNVIGEIYSIWPRLFTIE